VRSDHPVMILLYVLCVILVGTTTRLHRCVLLGLKAMFVVVFDWCIMGCLDLLRNCLYVLLVGCGI
jgi:hypothetical protein